MSPRSYKYNQVQMNLEIRQTTVKSSWWCVQEDEYIYSWVFGVPTAGWRNAPAFSPRGSTRGSAKLLGRSSFRARTQEHTDLEWFRPPERNTLRLLCVVLLLCGNESILCERVLERVLRPGWILASAGAFFLFSNGRLPFIVQGRRIHGCWTPTGRPNVDV